MYLQLNSLLFFSSLLYQMFYLCPISILRDTEKGKKLLFNLKKIRTGRARLEIFYAKSLIVNIIGNELDFIKPIGLKTRIVKLLKNCQKNFAEPNVRSWQLACDCHLCRDQWSRSRF